MIILVFKVVDLPINHCKRHFFIILLYIVIFLEVSFMTSFFDNCTLLNRMLKTKTTKKMRRFKYMYSNKSRQFTPYIIYVYIYIQDNGSCQGDVTTATRQTAQLKSNATQ